MNPYTENIEINDSFILLYPVLRLHGKECAEWLKKMSKCGVFVDDINNPNEHKDCLYVIARVLNDTFDCIDRKFKNDMEDIISFFSSKKYLKDMYILSVNNRKKPDKLVFVFRMPRSYNGTIDKFLEGNYDLFNKADIEYCWTPNDMKNKYIFDFAKKVLLGEIPYRRPSVKNEVLFL